MIQTFPHWLFNERPLHVHSAEHPGFKELSLPTPGSDAFSLLSFALCAPFWTLGVLQSADSLLLARLSLAPVSVENAVCDKDPMI